MDDTIKPFKINIADSELDLLQRKLQVTRLPNHNFTWTEENGITTSYLQNILDFWQNEYSWRKEEATINESLPQFTTKIAVDAGEGSGPGNEGFKLNIHFVHSPSTKTPSGHKQAIPLLFVHGWPGSFLEVSKGLQKLNDAGFHVVAPSCPGYGFSSYVPNRGFDHRGHARVMDRLMRKLGYNEYVAQGGDWGSDIVRSVGLLFPDRVKAVHVNMLQTPAFKFPDPQPTLTDHEVRLLHRAQKYFIADNSAYSQIQAERPISLGHAMHDSPLGLLSYIVDKLITWSDAYPWTPTELITWTLMHYFPGPTTGFVMYTENNPAAFFVEGSWANQYHKVPLGVSSFEKEIICMPRAWGEKVANLTFYREHDAGGHFAMWEVPDQLVADIADFIGEVYGSPVHTGEQ